MVEGRGTTHSNLCYRSLGESNAVHARQPLMRKAVAKRAAEIYKERFEEKESGTLPVTFQASPVSPLSRMLIALAILLISS